MVTYLPRMFKKEGLPIHIIYHCTYKCNSKCQTCFLWKNINSTNINRELTPEEIRKIRKTLKNILWLQIGGGEPFLRSDLPQLCEAFGDVDTIAIPTNCLDPEGIERNINEILKKNKSKVFLVLSLDGLMEAHDRIRGVNGNFEKVNEVYNRINKLRSRYPNFKIGVNTVITKANENEIIKVIDYVKRFFSPDMHAFEFLRGRPCDKNLSLPSIAKCRELVPMLKNCISSYSYGGGWRGKVLKKMKRYEQDLILRTLENSKKQVDCFAGNLSAVINPYGDVYICELIDEKIGNLRDFDYDFKKLWASPHAKEIREKVKDCFCTHSCVYLINTLFNPRVLPKMLLCKNQNYLKRRK